jgi:hypothetical protein
MGAFVTAVGPQRRRGIDGEQNDTVRTGKLTGVRRPSGEQLLRTFEKVLAEVLAGRGVRSCTGLDGPTQDALWRITRAHPDVRAGLVDAARSAFAGQLDGSNAARWREALARRTAGP